jgi:hypothetical protein
MRSSIEGIDLPHAEDPLLTYLHHVSIVFNGPVKLDDIFELMEQNITGRTNALRFLEALASYATDYAAIVTPSHPKWGGGRYDQRVSRYVQHVSQEIKMTFIRPLMLAVAARFTPGEALRAFVNIRSWVVRFLVAGGSRSGVTEKALGDAAHAITVQRFKTAAELADALIGVVPSDARFHGAFSRKALVSARQSRFILRQLEAQAREGKPEALEEPVSDTAMLTLEHILPKNPLAKDGWDHFTVDERKAYCYRLGNMVLLDAKDNGAIGDKPFKEKRPAYQKSKNFVLTADVVDRTETDPSLWTVAHITARQGRLADLAVKRWPLKSS